VWARPPADREQDCDITLLTLRNILRGIDGVRFDVLKVGGSKSCNPEVIVTLN
jgi:hypothetical protein